MTDKYYDIYFDRLDLEISDKGKLTNPKVLHIIEFEYDDADDIVTACRRVSKDGAVIETDPDLRDLEHAGYGDDPTIQEALDRFGDWLNDHLEWRELYPETRWQPAEYICIGIEGYTD